MEEKQKKVVLAMSGGVDSSISLMLLKEAGFEVTGVHFRIKERGYQEDERLARETARKFKIKLKLLDKRQEFKKTVVGYFLKEYARGNTPNPCVFCNKYFKFIWLFDEMKKEQADFVATGHYARLRRLSLKNGRKVRYALYKALDKSKDQSYFLYSLDQIELSRIIFPLGDLLKKDVKSMAKNLGLSLHDRKESQDVCFLAGTTVEKFLRKNLSMMKGEIEEKGKVLGVHQGLPLYTFGQRKGINIGGSGPYYVIGKDQKNHILKVSRNKEDQGLLSDILNLEEVNWIDPDEKKISKVKVRIRYQQEEVSAIIKKTGSRKARLDFFRPVWAATPGQAAVFSFRGEILGGGQIR